MEQPTFYLESYGCSANTANAEMISGILESAGMLRVSSPEHASVIIINTCIVKAPTEHKMQRRISEISAQFPEKKLIISGCMPDAEGKTLKKIAPKAILLGSHHVKKVLEALTRGRSFTGYSEEVKLGLPRHLSNPAICIVPISEGCLGNCSYCIVKLAKGKLHSYPVNEIVKEVKSGLRAGAREIWITSQDNSAYGRDLAEKSQLPMLLEEVTSIRGKFWVRVGMMNPDGILPVLDSLILRFRSEKVFKFIHIPVQSGNDEILRRMRRRYSVEDFKHIITEFRRKIPRITISTDIICGFPGETEEQFEDSINLIKWLRPDVLNISRFWPMPGTEAASMKNILNGNITKHRSQKLSRIFEGIALEKNKAEIGSECPVLVDEHIKENLYVARTEFYKPVSLRIDRRMLGQKKVLGSFARARITGATSNSLIGELVEY
ncbi:MAG: tRNA (N(6)-L-threonylcarbamoyladenosine(37)-C(2))-methylthiotransferase [Candidatus Woesearchaeota archaeon]